MFLRPFLLLTMKTKNHIVDKAFTGSSAGASAPGSGPGSRWFKSTLPENAKGTVSTVPFCIFRGHSGFETEHQQKPSVRWVLQRRWPAAGLLGGNHSFMMPGLISVAVATVLGYLMTNVFFPGYFASFVQ